MKKRNIPGIIFILFLSVFFAGCIEVSTLITINNDGSGTVEETVMLSKEIIDMISELQQSFASDTAEAEPFQFYNEKELRENARQFGEEVTYVSSRELNRDEKQGYIVMYEFRDLNGLRINQNPNSRVKLESFEEEPEPEEEFITFNFIKNAPSEIRIQMPLEKQFEKRDTMKTTVDSVSMDTTGMSEQLANIFKDLKMSLALQVNGKIIETNAEYVDNNKVTLLDINFGELISNADKMKEFQNADPQNFEQVKEILKGIPGIKVEYNNLVFIKVE